MIYTVQIIIDKDLRIDLFEIDIPKDEAQNVTDAFNAEREYCDFEL